MVTQIVLVGAEENTVIETFRGSIASVVTPLEALQRGKIKFNLSVNGVLVVDKKNPSWGIGLDMLVTTSYLLDRRELDLRSEDFRDYWGPAQAAQMAKIDRSDLPSPLSIEENLYPNPNYIRPHLNSLKEALKPCGFTIVCPPFGKHPLFRLVRHSL